MHDMIPGHALTVDRRVQVAGARGDFIPEATVVAVQPYSNHLGGRWAVVTLRLPGGDLLEGLDTRGPVFMSQEREETDWCSQCRAFRPVEERSREGSYQAGREIGFTVTRFECGHTDEGSPVDVGPAPGGEAAAEDQADRALRERQARVTHSMDRYGY